MPNYLILFLIIGITMLLTVKLRKLTPLAAATGGCIGALVYLGSGFTGITMMATFFILGTAATSFKGGTKSALGIAEENEGRRTAGQVIANAGVAAVLGLYVFELPQLTGLFRLMMAASFSAAIADTLSSELGNIYGSRYYNIVNFRKDQRGENGVISLEGTLCGMAGSIIIAAIYSVSFGWTIHFLWIIIGGTVGNIADSLLGATVERKRYLNNNAVNFLNTSIGALTAMALSWL